MPLILSLDGAEGTLEFYGFVLEDAGYQHIKVSSSHKALVTLRDQPVNLFTMNLPHSPPSGEMSGETLYAFLKDDKQLRHIPVLIISGCLISPKERTDQTLFRTMQGFGDDFLHKPFVTEELLAKVKNILIRHKSSSL